MRAERVSAEELLAGRPIAGAVLLAACLPAGAPIAKGTRLAGEALARIVAAARAGALAEPLRLGWAEPGDLHEDEAAGRLARAVAGTRVAVGTPRQSRIELRATVAGVLRVDIARLTAINRTDPLEVFTLFHGQAVREGQVVACVKVAPHLVEEAAVRAGEGIAAEGPAVVDIAPYLRLPVAAIAAEALTPGGAERFERAARSKVESLGGEFLGTRLVAGPDPGDVAARLAHDLRELAGRGAALVLVGGVSAGDPLSPFYDALARAGGRLLRRGVPAHPGSMIWLAELGETTLLGLPQCGMFSMATAADLVLPRLLTGERVTPDTLADLGHGGLLGPEMRFRFPDYARDLETPPDAPHSP